MFSTFYISRSSVTNKEKEIVWCVLWGYHISPRFWYFCLDSTLNKPSNRNWYLLNSNMELVVVFHKSDLLSIFDRLCICTFKHVQYLQNIHYITLLFHSAINKIECQFVLFQRKKRKWTVCEDQRKVLSSWSQNVSSM